MLPARISGKIFDIKFASAFWNTRRHINHQNKQTFAARITACEPVQSYSHFPLQARKGIPAPHRSPLSPCGILCIRLTAADLSFLRRFWYSVFSIITIPPPKGKRFANICGDFQGLQGTVTATLTVTLTVPLPSPEDALAGADLLHRKPRILQDGAEGLIGKGGIHKDAVLFIVRPCARNPIGEEQFLFCPLGTPLTAKIFDFNYLLHGKSIPRPPPFVNKFRGAMRCPFRERMGGIRENKKIFCFTPKTLAFFLRMWYSNQASSEV